jgi:hypothetical protein
VNKDAIENGALHLEETARMLLKLQETTLNDRVILEKLRLPLAKLVAKAKSSFVGFTKESGFFEGVIADYFD